LDLTRQKYRVPYRSELTAWEVPVIEESSNAVEPKSESKETCSLYVVAPVDGFHWSVTGLGWPVAPAKGEPSVGTDGNTGAGTMVVKFHTAEKALLPALFLALTRQ
jgi:hypothetical protein